MRIRAHIIMGMALIACGQRHVGEPDVGPPPDVGMPGSSGPGPGEGEVVCRDGLTLCDGACVDLSSSDEHCGACSHVCKRPSVFGICMDGKCPPALFCGGRDRGFRTCDEVCASHGQTCYGGPHEPQWGGCGGGYRVYFPDFNEDALEFCEGAIGSHRGIEAMCSSPIDWSQRGGLENSLAGAVACCCTQEPP